VLLLQPEVVMVVVITSAGAVTKRIVAFDRPVDSGLANWARQYLNEQLVGVQLGTQLLRRRLDDPGLNPVERNFVERLRPAFTELVALDEQRLFVGGAAGLLDEVRDNEVSAYRSLLELLERRRALLDVIAEALDPRRPFVRVGGEIANPALHELALVGAAYGLSNRTLGAVSLVGPVRMDYDKAIRSVRAAASELSRFSEELFGEN
jgi:heat-inducible transcriptional repressor